MYDFDIDSKLIQLTTVNDLDLQHLYSTWKNEILSNLASAQQAFRVVKEPLVGSTFIGPYYFIMNNWQIRPYDSAHVLDVSGTVVKDATQTLDPFKLDDLTSPVSINQLTAIDVQIAEVRAPLTDEQSTHLMGLDTTNLDVAVSTRSTFDPTKSPVIT